MKKYLSDYISEPQTKAFKKHGGFWAFSDKQFEEQRDKSLDLKDYTHLSGGLFCPKDTADSLVKELEQVVKEGIKQDLEENGKGKVIERELYNHEAFYTGCIVSTIEALRGYDITEGEILKVYHEIQKKRRDEDYKDLE